MARPSKQGLDYFPLDVSFFEDTKIEYISAKFGLKGEAIILRLLAKIYKENGYYIRFNDDDILLFTRKLGSNSGASAQFVRAVVSEAASRGLFDEAIWRNFHVLTSRGIQKRYVKACKDSRRALPDKLEYDLIDYNSHRSGISSEKTPVSSVENPVNSVVNSNNSGENPSFLGENPSLLGGNSADNVKHSSTFNTTQGISSEKTPVYSVKTPEKTPVSSVENPDNSGVYALKQNKLINNKYIYIYNGEEPKNKASPCLKEIEEYALTAYPDVDAGFLRDLAKRFFNFYEAQDWHTSGLNKITKWQAKFEQWIINELNELNEINESKEKKNAAAKRGFDRDKYKKDLEYLKRKFGV